MYLYILLGTQTGKYYIGVTKNLEQRVRSHNINTSHYTGRQHDIWKIVYSKYYRDGREARVEEIRLKKARNKKYIEWYIAHAGA